MSDAKVKFYSLANLEEAAPGSEQVFSFRSNHREMQNAMFDLLLGAI